MKNSSLRVALLLLLVLALLPASLAFAEKGERSPSELKAEQAAEPYWDPIGDQILANVPEDELTNNACPGQAFSCGDILTPAAISPGGDLDYIWFTANAGDIVTFGTDTALGADPDTKITLYNSDCTKELAFNDDGGPGLFSLIEFCVAETGTYVGLIEGYSAFTTGDYVAFVTCAPGAPPPPNDTCDGAIPIMCGPISEAGSTTGSCITNDYTTDFLGGCTGYSARGKDLVYVVHAAAGWTLDVTYTTTADGSFYLVTDCADIEGSCVAGADNTLSGDPETFIYNFTAAGAYYLILDSFGTDTSGDWTLTGILDCGPVAVEQTSWSQVKTLFQE